jgi:hypothetical protein
VACINAYRLYLLHSVDIHPLTYLQFRTELYCKLFEYSSKAKLQNLRVRLGGKRVFNSDSNTYPTGRNALEVFVYSTDVYQGAKRY